MHTASQALTRSTDSQPAKQATTRNLAFLFPVVIAAITAFCLGYDAGVMSGAIAPIVADFNLSSFQEGLVVGCINIIAAPGALFGGKLADWKGRVLATMTAAVILLIGPVLVATSTGFWLLFLGRLITGFGGGLSFAVAPLYGAEMAPPRIRAAIVAISDVLVNFGIVIGYLSAMLLQVPALEGSTGWRLVTGLAAAPAFFTLCCWCLLPESPRWLLQQGRQDAAVAVLRRMGTPEDSLSEEIRALEEALAEQDQEAGWGQVLMPSPPVRRMLVAGLGVAFFQQISGSEAIVYYTPKILEQLGLDSDAKKNVGTILVGTAKFLGACCGAICLDMLGRKPAMVLSTAGVSLCVAGLAILQGSGQPLVALGLCLLCGYMLIFELALAPGPYVLGTECYPLPIRAKAMSLGIFIGRFLSGLVSIAFPPLVNAVSLEPCLWVFCVCGAVGVPWALFCVPETKGLSLEEATQLFDQPISCRKTNHVDP